MTGFAAPSAKRAAADWSQLQAHTRYMAVVRHSTVPLAFCPATHLSAPTPPAALSGIPPARCGTPRNRRQALRGEALYDADRLCIGPVIVQVGGGNIIKGW